MTKIQKNCLASGRYRDDLVLAVSSHGRNTRIRIEENITMTPASLFGIERSIA
jgi:hypothetical protein